MNFLEFFNSQWVFSLFQRVSIWRSVFQFCTQVACWFFMHWWVTVVYVLCFYNTDIHSPETCIWFCFWRLLFPFECWKFQSRFVFLLLFIFYCLFRKFCSYVPFSRQAWIIHRFRFGVIFAYRRLYIVCDVTEAVFLQFLMNSGTFVVPGRPLSDEIYVSQMH